MRDIFNVIIFIPGSLSLCHPEKNNNVWYPIPWIANTSVTELKQLLAYLEQKSQNLGNFGKILNTRRPTLLLLFTLTGHHAASLKQKKGPGQIKQKWFIGVNCQTGFRMPGGKIHQWWNRCVQCTCSIVRFKEVLT